MKAPQQIRLFLHNLKCFVEKNGFTYVPREASDRFLAERNMTYDELTRIIMALEVSDCFDGPEPDRDPRYADKWTVAEFSPAYQDEKLYLKLSIRMDAERAKCLSVKLYTEGSCNHENV